jgi:hypothetical protein
VNTWKIILATMLIFGTGVVTGGLLVRHAEHIVPGVAQRTSPQLSKPAHPITAGAMRIDILRRLERELDLMPDQKERIDKIIKESQERSHDIMEPVAPQLREELQRTKDQFRAVLTPAQQVRFDAILKQQQKPHEKGRPPRDRVIPPAGTPIEGDVNRTSPPPKP